MPDETRYRQPKELASRLEISTSTLRRWSGEFADFLSAGAGDKQNRRYTDEDMATLISIKEFMSDGLGYEQVRQHLKQLKGRQEKDERGEETRDSIRREETVDVGSGDSALVTAEHGIASDPAIKILGETLHAMSGSQQAILNSQAANRELIGVVIQDNFNLKEENTHLRERMLELERQMETLRRDEETRRDEMRREFEDRLKEVRAMVVLESRKGCLGSIFGGSESQEDEDYYDAD